MKKIYILIVLAALAMPAAAAQKNVRGVIVSEPEISKTGESVTVAFRAEIGKRTVKSSYSIVFAPVITNDAYSWSMPAIIVQGRKARMGYERYLAETGNPIHLSEAITAANGETVEYTQTIPYQMWMEGARLVMESIVVGCCAASPTVADVMVGELALQPSEPVMIVQAEDPAPVVAETPKSTADKLAESFLFLSPVSEAHGEIYDEDRNEALQIHFPQGQRKVLFDFAGNSRSLIDLMSSIRAIERSGDSRVASILIAGFASPEGSFSLNDRLAWNRAIALKEYIMSNSAIDDGMIRIHNGSEDWQGLRMMVEASDIPWKRQVIEIIDTVPIWDSYNQIGRLSELMKLDQGRAYRYMLRYMFPQLRSAAYIKVYYENTDN